MSIMSADRRILIVEDDPDLGDVLAHVLETAGYQIALARDGREALRYLKDYSADLVLLDLMMPVMNGWEFRAEQMRDPALNDIPVMAFSGDAHVDQKAASIGAVGSLRKPISRDELLSTVAGVWAAPHEGP